MFLWNMLHKNKKYLYSFHSKLRQLLQINKLHNKPENLKGKKITLNALHVELHGSSIPFKFWVWVLSSNGLYFLALPTMLFGCLLILMPVGIALTSSLMTETDATVFYLCSYTSSSLHHAIAQTQTCTFHANTTINSIAVTAQSSRTG